MIRLIVVPGTLDAKDFAAAQQLSGSTDRLSAQDLIDSVPHLDRVAQVVPLDFRRVSSHALTDVDLLDLASVVGSALEAADVDGVVVTHGTNNLEETAYFLSLVLDSSKPVVVTGAMRPFRELSSDGPANLRSAVRVAADPQSSDRGTLVVFGSSIFAARDVTKTSTQEIEPFGSLDAGRMGSIDNDGTLHFYGMSLRARQGPPLFSLGAQNQLPKVDIALSYLGADGTSIAAYVAAAARGIVTAGAGAGVCTPAEAEALLMATAAGVTVCQSSRVWGGRVAATPARRTAGFVSADNLNPWKARVLLQLALTHTSDPREVQRYFDIA